MHAHTENRSKDLMSLQEASIFMIDIGLFNLAEKNSKPKTEPKLV